MGPFLAERPVVSANLSLMPKVPPPSPLPRKRESILLRYLVTKQPLWRNQKGLFYFEGAPDSSEVPSRLAQSFLAIQPLTWFVTAWIWISFYFPVGRLNLNSCTCQRTLKCCWEGFSCWVVFDCGTFRDEKLWKSS